MSPNHISTFFLKIYGLVFLLRFTIPLSTKYLPYPGLPFLFHYHSPLKTNQFLVKKLRMYSWTCIGHLVLFHSKHSDVNFTPDCLPTHNLSEIVEFMNTSLNLPSILTLLSTLLKCGLFPVHPLSQLITFSKIQSH